jgi:hypothetical protein
MKTFSESVRHRVVMYESCACSIYVLGFEDLRRVESTDEYGLLVTARAVVHLRSGEANFEPYCIYRVPYNAATLWLLPTAVSELLYKGLIIISRDVTIVSMFKIIFSSLLTKD